MQEWKCLLLFVALCLPARIALPFALEQGASIALGATYGRWAASCTAAGIGIGLIYHATKPNAHTTGGFCRPDAPARWHYMRPLHAFLFGTYALLRAGQVYDQHVRASVLLVSAGVGAISHLASNLGPGART